MPSLPCLGPDRPPCAPLADWRVTLPPPWSSSTWPWPHKLAEHSCQEQVGVAVRRSHICGNWSAAHMQWLDWVWQEELAAALQNLAHSSSALGGCPLSARCASMHHRLSGPAPQTAQLDSLMQKAGVPGLLILGKGLACYLRAASCAGSSPGALTCQASTTCTSPTRPATCGSF